MMAAVALEGWGWAEWVAAVLEMAGREAAGGAAGREGGWAGTGRGKSLPRCTQPRSWRCCTRLGPSR